MSPRVRHLAAAVLLAGMVPTATGCAVAGLGAVGAVGVASTTADDTEWWTELDVPELDDPTYGEPSSGPDEIEESLPLDPAYAEHFTDPSYRDLADELAPFGNDAGYDIMFWTVEDAAPLAEGTTVQDLLDGYGFGEATDVYRDDLDAAQFVVGAAFALLRFAGYIDPTGRRDALGALAVLGSEVGDPAYAEQRDDLTTWRNPPTYS